VRCYGGEHFIARLREKQFSNPREFSKS